MGLRRMKAKTITWRFMQRYEAMKKSKGSGRAIIATARKIAVVIWNMLTDDVEFDLEKMVDKKLAKKSESMSGSVGVAKEAVNEVQEKPVITDNKKKDDDVKKSIKETGVAREKIKKAG